MTNKQRKNDRIRAEKLAKEAEASKKAKEAAKEAAKKEKKQKEGKKEKKQQEGEVKEKKPKEEVSNTSAETKSEWFRGSVILWFLFFETKFGC